MNETPVVGREKPREYKNQKKKHVHHASHTETKKNVHFLRNLLCVDQKIFICVQM